MLMFNGYFSFADRKNKLFSMHFYQSSALHYWKPHAMAQIMVNLTRYKYKAVACDFQQYENLTDEPAQHPFKLRNFG